jgi:hypothetical protein
MLGLLGLLIRIIMAGAAVATVVVVGLAVVPTPRPCTPDVALPVVSDVFARWDAFVRGAAPQQVRFDEAEATATLQRALEGAELPVSDVRVHFCADGTAQLAFTYRWGPVSAHALATGTLPAASPLRLSVDEVAIGGLPTVVTDPALDAARGLLDRVTSLSLVGPIDRVEVEAGSIVIFHD